jgi:hypothetical protein
MAKRWEFEKVGRLWNKKPKGGIIVLLTPFNTLKNSGQQFGICQCQSF